MVSFDRTILPGVGVRHDFVTRDGRRIGVITHHGGRRDLLVYSDADPDACQETLALHEEDSVALVELLGGSRVASSLHEMQQRVEGLAIDWVELQDKWWAAGRTVGDTELRRRTGVSVVAIVQGDHAIPSPGPDQQLSVGDTVVAVGTPAGLKAASAILRAG